MYSVYLICTIIHGLLPGLLSWSDWCGMGKIENTVHFDQNECTVLYTQNTNYSTVVYCCSLCQCQVIITTEVINKLSSSELRNFGSYDNNHIIVII